MSKFEDAFKRGQDAYRDAVRAKAEINAVFAQLSTDIQAATNNHVAIRFGTLDRLKKVPNTIVNAVLGVLPESEKYDALIAERIGGSWSDRAELCSVKLSPNGWPVELTFPGQYLTASDRASLETSLETLISHPDIAAKIAQVLATKVTAPPPAEGS
jgi:hypothetical protein